MVFGTLLVFFTIRMARRLSRSTLVGAIAGVLLTFDGLAFVMSRLALLDIFQATFAVAAVSALIADRDWFRHKLADHLRANNLPDLGGAFGPLLLWRPWRAWPASCSALVRREVELDLPDRRVRDPGGVLGHRRPPPGEAPAPPVVSRR